jgi:hypothetical protein
LIRSVVLGIGDCKCGRHGELIRIVVHDDKITLCRTCRVKFLLHLMKSMRGEGI